MSLWLVGNHKHRTLLTTAYATGLRVSEATHLKVTDVDSQRMMLRVEQGKGNKDRYVMLSPRLLDTLRTYWKISRPPVWLFPGDIPGQPISRHAVGQICQKARRVAGIEKPITPHSLRHYAEFWTMPTPSKCDGGGMGFALVLSA